jgi:hypothetical protein
MVLFAVEEPTAEQREAEEAFFGHLEAEEHPVTGTVPAVGDRPAVPAEAESVPGPWDDPDLPWPEAFEDCAFLGGHPVHQRRRKTCTLLFERAGLLAATPRQGWHLHVPWHDVARLDVQGSDEIKFTHNQRVSSDSSVLVVDLVDGTTLLFEARRMRPATVRGAVAPIRAAVDQVHAR